MADASTTLTRSVYTCFCLPMQAQALRYMLLHRFDRTRAPYQHTDCMLWVSVDCTVCRWLLCCMPPGQHRPSTRHSGGGSQQQCTADVQLIAVGAGVLAVDGGWQSCQRPADACNAATVTWVDAGHSATSATTICLYLGRSLEDDVAQTLLPSCRKQESPACQRPSPCAHADHHSHHLNLLSFACCAVFGVPARVLQQQPWFR